MKVFHVRYKEYIGLKGSQLFRSVLILRSQSNQFSINIFFYFTTLTLFYLKRANMAKFNYFQLNHKKLYFCVNLIELRCISWPV